MPGRKFEDSVTFRKQVQNALDNGNTTPTEVLNYIVAHAERGEALPSLPTVSRIMQDVGYEPPTKDWKKGK